MPYEQLPITGPFKGIVDSLPRPYKPAEAWDDLLNMIPHRGRLITRPRLNAFSTAPDGATLWNLIPFADILANLHNLALTAKDAYMITPGPVWNGPLLLPAWSAATTYVLNDAVNFSGITYWALQASTNKQPDTEPTFWAPIDGNTGITSLPWGYEIINGRVYFSNGSFGGLYADGETTIKSARHPGAWQFCQTLANHLVTANTIEPAPQIANSTAFPYRVRWSASGDPNTWTEGAGSTAGHNDLVEESEAITGYNTLGRTGYVWRPTGVTMMTPTGIGTAPFQFDPLKHSPKGVGVAYPYSLDAYGDIAGFVSEEDVYTFDGAQFTPIGGDARSLIFADIGTSDPNQIIGTTLGRFNPKFRFLSYWLSLPSSVDGDPVTWLFSWDDRQWARFRSGTKQLTTIARLVL